MSTSAATPRPATRGGAEPRAGRQETPVPSITDAAESLEDDQARRMRRYLWQMGLRVVFFVAAYFVSGWLRWTFIVFAAVIPYVAVLLVNAGRDRVTYTMSAVRRDSPQELTELPETARVIVDPGDAAPGQPVPDHTVPDADVPDDDAPDDDAPDPQEK